MIYYFNIFSILLIVFPHNLYADYKNTINPSVTYGVWEGWGTSLAWWANAFGTRDDLADLMFSTKNVSFNSKVVPGLGLNIIRYNVGGCSSVAAGTDKMVASSSIPKYKQIEGYWLNWNSSDPTSSSWDWTVDKNQRAMVAKAMARGADHVEMFSNSPMWWMLKNHNPSGASDGGDNLMDNNYSQFAVYLATVAKYAADHWGITFKSIEPFNEATSSWWKSGGTQEGCHISSAVQQQVIKYLKQEMDKRSLTKTVISASDENTYDGAVTLWNSFPADVKAGVSQINVHGYQGASGARDKLYALAHNGNKVLWNSEYGESDASGIPMASNLGLDIFWMHPTAWVYWQPFDGPGWGMIEAHLDKLTVGEVAPKYYVMAQYSRHIRKGMVILESGRSDSTVAYDKSNSRLIIVTLNKETTQQTVTLDLTKFTKLEDQLVKEWTTNDATNGKRYVFSESLKVVNKTITCVIGSRTVQTIEVDNVSI